MHHINDRVDLKIGEVEVRNQRMVIGIGMIEVGMAITEIVRMVMVIMIMMNHLIVRAVVVRRKFISLDGSDRPVLDHPNHPIHLIITILPIHHRPAQLRQNWINLVVR